MQNVTDETVKELTSAVNELSNAIHSLKNVFNDDGILLPTVKKIEELNKRLTALAHPNKLNNK